jgi:hypothetical protein
MNDIPRLFHFPLGLSINLRDPQQDFHISYNLLTFPAVIYNFNEIKYV